MSNRRKVADVSVSERKRHIHLLLSVELDAVVRALAAEGRRPITTQIELLIERGLRAEQVAA